MKSWEVNNNFPVHDVGSMSEWGLDENEDDEGDPIGEDADSHNSDSEGERDANRSHHREPEDFEKALEMFNFRGSFVETERYSMAEASNPWPIGLPLTIREARALISHLGADASMRLEIEAEKVSFRNPAWDAWLQKVGGAVCATMAGKKVKPSYRLNILVLEATSSQPSNTAYAYAPDVSDAVGTLVVILPSLFEGGQLQYQHGIQSKTVDFAEGSQLATSVVAAYSAVKSTISPLTSGYRLLPLFPDMDVAAENLKRAMLELQESPELVAYFLQRRYPMKNFSLQALSGPDALLMAHLSVLTKELDFRLYVVQVELYTTQFGNYEGPPDKIDRRKIENMDEEDECRSVRENAVDANSIPVKITGFDFQYDDYLNGEIRDVEPDHEYEFIYEERLRIDETYGRTLVLLSPSTEALEPVKIRYSQKYACWALNSSISTTPSTREKILVESLLEDREAMEANTRTLFKCAEQWADVQLLLRTLETNKVAGDLGLVGIPQCISAYQAFGWNALKSFFHDAVEKDISNQRRQALVTELIQAAQENVDTEVKSWCAEQQEFVLRSLNLASISEVDWLLDLGTVRGADFIRDIVYPQLQAQPLESIFWVQFVRRLREHSISVALGDDFARQGALQAIETLPAFPVDEVKQSDYPYTRKEAKDGLVMDVFRLLIETRNTALCTDVFEKMKEAALSGTFDSEFPPWVFYLKLAQSQSLDEYLQSLPEPDAIVFQPFFKETLRCILSGLEKAGQTSFKPCPFAEENLPTLVIAIRRAGGLSFLAQCINEAVLAGRDFASLKVLVNYFITTLRPPPEDVSATEGYTAVINGIVRRAIDVFDTKSFHTPLSKDNPLPMRSIEHLVDMVKFCFQAGARSEWQYLLLHLVSPPPGITIPQHVSKVLAPFMPALRDYLTSQALDFEVDPFKKFSANVVKAFAATVMSQKPQDLVPIASIGCSSAKCGDCKSLRDFFYGDNRCILFPRAAKARQHVSEQLWTPKSWGVTVELKKERSPHALEITKPDKMTVEGLWAESSERGQALLALLGDERAQKRILGSDYNVVLTQILGAGGARSNGTKRGAADDHMGASAKKARSS
ncbi:hypothetical protein B0H10DRAFT_2004181 [Mycena sp. CBHHK59/15]|nr:hypothetical protein B0H10DRAFT_2004181 [Mycena sp. CBHHK59/15]